MTHKRDLEFLYEMGCIRFIQRSWRRFLNANYQNLAEHHFRVAWIALMLAKHENVQNIDKVMKLALIHDIEESRTGDVDYLSRQFVDRHGDEAISDMFKGTAIEEFKSLWNEYKEKKTPEARIVKDADLLDVDLEIQEQSYVGHDAKEKFHPDRYKIYDKLYSNTAKQFWKMIQESNPHDWHINAKNRFNSGDWKKQ
jgi:putative hydrolase of HD superfamily